MIAALFMLAILSIILILPGWLWFRRTCPQSAWPFGLPVFGIWAWVALSATDLGSTQSLSNTIEAFWVAVASVLAAYFKFFALDRSPTLRSKGTLIVFALLALATVGIRAFTPTLPE